MEVCDAHSDVTIFSIGGGVEVAGRGATYDFRGVLLRRGARYNRVFIRDPHLSCYHATPDGKPGGLACHIGKISDMAASLGSTYNIGLGASMGASAALYFGARCGFDDVVAFSPLFPLPEFGDRWSPYRAWANVGLLVRSPSRYLFDAALISMSRMYYRRTKQFAGEGGINPMIDEIRRSGLRRATIYYGSKCCTDERHARLVADCGPVRYVVLAGAGHDSSRFLKLRGELTRAIMDPIEAGLAEHRGAGGGAAVPSTLGRPGSEAIGAPDCSAAALASRRAKAHEPAEQADQVSSHGRKPR
jgi:hypothetical protein